MKLIHIHKILKPRKYKISNNYIVHTSYGKKNNHKTVICSIYYCGKDAKFRVVYGDEYNDYVESKESPLAVANLYQKAIESKTKKKKNLNEENQKKTSSTKWNGILLFGLQLQQIKDIQEIKQINHSLKPYLLLSKSD
ncbi:13577_t:CDS:2 [Dentiscutata heterogama]|uniref:13577_t:CDS:1 n=1 Tax=Dentiscutata heterogama TaxID=1316150 RepID=A0ACA9K7Q8_9GLOM|nr:13577_t:CDS:2 [Dentiscutata heterogama]